MPNWVSNSVTIDGDEATLATIAETLAVGATEDSDETPISFNRVIPRPDDEDDWYTWHTTQWGTKWDACNPESELDGSLYYRFDTAWNAPIPVFERLSVQYPDVTITLSFEEEQGWGGERMWQAGNLLDTSDYDIPTSHEERLERNQYCWCEPTEPVYEDCFYFQVLDMVEAGTLTMTDTEKDMVRSLAKDWSGDLNALIAAVRSIEEDASANR